MSEPQPRRLLMTVDAVGGVWRYSMDLAHGLRNVGTEVVFACLGPRPSHGQVAEAEQLGRLVLLDAPLDWTSPDRHEVAAVPAAIADVVAKLDVDLLHLNAPSQAAGLEVELPVVVVSHSCVVTWFRAVRGSDVPDDWAWQRDINRLGLEAADVVVAPSKSHAELMRSCYSNLPPVHIAYNAVRPLARSGGRLPYVIAAGRWWDEGKGARILDEAATLASLPIKMAGSVSGPNGQWQAIEHAEALGELASAEVRDLMTNATAFASPSIYEPFGLAPLEAASAGVPLVLSDIPTYRELWDGVALFAAPGDAAGFADQLNRLAASPKLCAELGELAAQRAAGFTLPRQVAGMGGAYGAALRSRERRNQRVSA